jgi:demethylmenaquinone methyltransferase/2-methoxy-6-polyprenyl-1,4-benzoquinol methylase
MTEHQDYYSTIAAGYDELYGVEQDEKLKEFLAKVDIPYQANLLDVGCGTGRSNLLLPQVRWQGIDPSPGLIAHAHEDIRRKIICCRGEELPFPPSMFDYVLSLTALQNFDDADKGLSEMQRVLRPQGTLLLSFLKRSERAGHIVPLVEKHFEVSDSWQTTKDFMFICKQKQ